jgi:hypothetical protein
MARQTLISECKRRRDNGEELDSLINFLRSSGCSKIDSIAIIVEGCGIDLSQAKKAVHLSPTWADTRIADNHFHDVIEDAVSDSQSDE